MLQLLEAVWEPFEVAVMHCRNHQRDTNYVSRASHMAKQATKRAAEELSSPGALTKTAKFLLALELPPTPNYTKEDEQSAKDEKGIKEKGGS
jgi:hypothetical protein